MSFVNSAQIKRMKRRVEYSRIKEFVAAREAYSVSLKKARESIQNKDRENTSEKVDINKKRGRRNMLYQGTLSTIDKAPCLKSSAPHNDATVS